MAEFKNTFLKGRMNQDLDSRIIPNGEYREAINLLISRSEGSTVGEFENVLGNSKYPLTGGKEKVIGSIVDEANNFVYLFTTDWANDDGDRAPSTKKCYILRFDLTNPSTATTLVSGYWLNFNQKFPIYGINIVEDLLFWTDNLNQPRRISISTANNNSLAYTLESQISVAKYYPYNPLIPMDRSTATVAAQGTGNTSTKITVTIAQPNVRIGDVVTDNNKTSFANLEIGNSTPLVKVVKITSPTVFEVSPAISGGALSTGHKIDFSRTSMENHSDLYLSNWSTQTVGNVRWSGSGFSGQNLLTYVTAGPGINGAPFDATPNLTTSGTPGTTAGFTTTSTLGTGAQVTVSISNLGGISALTVSGNALGWALGDTISIATSVIGGSTGIVITLTQAALGGLTEVTVSSPILGGVPRVGDLVTLASPNAANIPIDLRVAQLTVTNVTNTNTGIWTIGFDADATEGGTKPGFAINNVFNIAVNPLHDSSFPGDTKILEDKFVRFSYRFKFNDNEYSLIAPFTQAMFIPKQYGEFGLGQIDIKSPPNNASTDPGISNYYQDETDAYTSTILQWFENDVDSIGLKIPIPTSLTELQTLFNVKEIDILYRESDGIAIKVLDSVDVDDIATSETSTINYDNFTNGLKDQLYYGYSYTSNRPYKTLPESQTTRVYDKVPVKALAQELISNRIVYGNFLQRQTPPEAINYSVGITNRDAQASDYSTQYPYQNIKQNRIYQVGFVLSDYYGRQSDVILSSNDNKQDTIGSSIYVPYRTSNDATTAPVIDWLGKNLTLSIEEAIGANTTIGIYREHGFINTFTLSNIGGGTYYPNETYRVTGGTGSGCTVRVTLTDATPGKITTLAIVTAGSGYTNADVLTVGNGSATITVATTGLANPLGWYSYKVVIKQQEQEYYNVYLPGFVNGLPVQNRRVTNSTRPVVAPLVFEPVDTQRGKIAFSTLIGENLNKVPRSLNEVGPTDNEFNSEEIFYIRINNSNAVSATDSKNLQYYPSNLSQNVLSLATVKETQLAAVPFVAFNAGNRATGLQGEYNSTIGITDQGLQPISPQTAEDITGVTPSGSIPWGDVSSTASFYGADQNPFIMKFSTVGTSNNPVGSIVGGSNESPQSWAMRPMLSVIETRPVNSLLDIFWESTMSGELEVLNSYINSSVDNVIATDISSGTFSEATAINATVGAQIKFINGSGAEIGNITAASISRVVSQNNPSVPLNIADYFSIALIGTAPSATAVQLSATKAYWYGVNSNAIPSSGVYIFDIQVSSGGTVLNPTYTDTLTSCFTLTLTNVAPVIYSDAAYAIDISTPADVYAIPNPAVNDTTIVQLYGLNGSVDEVVSDSTENRTKELVWSIGTVFPSSATGVFSMSNSGLITTSTTLVNEQAYTIFVELKDVNATGTNSETANVTIGFTAGTANAPKIIGTGTGIASTAQKNMTGGTAEFAFINSDVYTGSAVGSPFAITPTFIYNAQSIYNGTAAGQTACPAGGRADLFQGTIEIKPNLFNVGTSIGDVTILFSIQYRLNSSSSWSNIDSIAGVGYATWLSTQSQQQISHSTTVANQETAFKYKFDQLGEYRVITNQMSQANAGNVGQFTVDFKDGTYNTNAGPCKP